MTRSIALAAATLCVATISPALGGPVAPGSTVEGKTIGEWTADWWNWAGSVPNVFSDVTGSQATLNQSGPVFFVAGTSPFTGVSTATREFEIPEGKFVLFPLLNWIVANGADPGFSSTAEEVEALVDGTIDPDLLFASVDGVEILNLEQHRERSPIDFTFTPSTASAGFPPGTYTDANADGYWVMLEPLDVGTHTIHFGGTSVEFTGPDPVVSVPSFSVEVTDNVTVVDGSTVIPLPPAALGALPVLAGLWGSVQWRRRRSLR